MAKRFATMFFIMIGIVVFLISAYIMVLFLAPGLSIFGLRYIAINTRGVQISKMKIRDAMYQAYGSNSFSGNIIVNSDNIPVIVNFSETGYDSYYEYYDNFSGITKSDLEYPSITLTKNAAGDAVFSVKSFQKYIFENANTNRYIKIYIPLSGISVSDNLNKTQFTFDDGAGVPDAYKRSLIINAGSGSVTFEKNDTTRAPTFNQVTIKTTNNVYNGNVHLKSLNFDFETNKTIKIDNHLNNLVDAKNYNLKTTSGNITVSRSLSGNLCAETKNGNINFSSCENFKAVTDLGDIIMSNKSASIEIKGIVDIKTNAGNIKLGNISGTGENKIVSGSGEVLVNKLLNGSITTHRGSVNIKSVNNVNIETNMGNIKVEESLESIKVSTKRGKIQLGDQGMVMKSPTAFSNLGNITIKNASGNVNIEALSGNITFVNHSSENIKIYAGGNLTAENLKGLVDITTNRLATISFEKINKNVEIKATKNCSYIRVNAVSVIAEGLDYNFSGNPVSLYESNNTGFNSFSLIYSDNNLVNTILGATKFQIVGLNEDGSNKAKVDLYFGNR